MTTREEVIVRCAAVNPVGQMRPQRDDERHTRGEMTLEPPRRADAHEGPHQESQIETADVHQEPLQNVVVTTEMRASQATRFVQVSVRSF